MLMMSTSMWGQVNISDFANLRGASAIGSPSTPNRPSTTLPDSNQTATDSTSTEGLNGIEYHEDIPDSTLQASIFLFHRLPMEVKIM